MPRDLVDNAPGRRPDTKYGHAPSLDLRPSRVLDHLGGDAHVPRRATQLEEVVLRLDLHGDLGLAVPLPAGEGLALG